MGGARQLRAGLIGRGQAEAVRRRRRRAHSRRFLPVGSTLLWRRRAGSPAGATTCCAFVTLRISRSCRGMWAAGRSQPSRPFFLDDHIATVSTLAACSAEFCSADPFGWQPCASADEDPYACLHAGVWQGSIGNAPVTLSFEISERSDEPPPSGSASLQAPFGHDYYRDQWQDLLLVPDKAVPRQWDEMDPAGRVTDHLSLTCRERQLSGVWRSADSGQSAPIEAKVVRGRYIDSFFVLPKKGAPDAAPPP